MFRFFLGFFISIFLASSVYGEYLPMNLSELITKSDGIYSVYCEKAVPEKRNNDIFTNFDFKVLDTIKGNDIKLLNLSLRGGSLSGESVLDPDMVPIRSGDSYVLFTRRGLLYPQGIFTVTSSGVFMDLTKVDIPLFTTQGVSIAKGSNVQMDDLSFSLRKWISERSDSCQRND